jgi:carbonic anhydrase
MIKPSGAGHRSEVMRSFHFTRRQILGSAAVFPFLARLAAAEPPGTEPSPKDASEALSRLRAGNARFADGRTRHAHQSADWRKQLVVDQTPFATILGCSDSRVPPELVFDQGFGDLFVIRVAGNVIDTDVVGSIQYAVRHLKTQLLVIMGHEGCGAVTATLAAMDGTAKEPRFVEALAKRIEPGLKDLNPKLAGEARLAAAVEANVRWAEKQIVTLPEGKQALEEKAVMFVGAVYELKTGRVRFLA